MGISRAWGPQRRWACGQLLGGVVLLGLAPRTDRAGWLLLVPVALAALGFGLRDVVLTPVLTADDEGLTVVSGLRREHALWDEVERIRVVRDRRTPLLEVDLGDRLVVLSARRLGAPVEQVADALAAERG